ncbi:chemotaxis protein CheD [Caulobacter endophyticus]|uniref:Probable chemoreceptor glutamine deamidase CheD n=1 Tax=Caulobacter endophyticus TaxID=2172652 RepID=A0A2T9JQA3_9CAUL|nr:chemotaxis protein CheD [Caulobacter endophyticus]PVM85900.1 chemotaxis protein CheD [Caulobacter endophyticus]
MIGRDYSHDDELRATKVHVTQGESHVSTDPNVVMTTVLGSCIAACIRDPQAGVGGMNHFLLPDAGDGRSGSGGDAVRYGAYAMELLINGLLKKGARRERLEAKIFGGGKLFDSLSDVGASNAAFAERFLRDEGIPIVSSSVGGVSARRVEFWPVTGRVRQRLVAVDNAPQEVRRPAPIPQPASNAGDLELF